MRFPRDRRLAEGAVFDALLKSGRRVQAGPVGGRLAPSAMGASAPARLGITVAKRHLKRAVDRNTVKRLIREAFRHHAENVSGSDMLISLRFEPQKLRSRQGRAVVNAALDQLFKAALRKPTPAVDEHA